MTVSQQVMATCGDIRSRVTDIPCWGNVTMWINAHPVSRCVSQSTVVLTRRNGTWPHYWFIENLCPRIYLVLCLQCGMFISNCAESNSLLKIFLEPPPGYTDLWLRVQECMDFPMCSCEEGSLQMLERAQKCTIIGLQGYIQLVATSPVSLKRMEN